MLSRALFALMAFALALVTTACSSLTRPDEIVIAAEPPAPPVVKPLPAAPPARQVRGAAPEPAGGGG